MIAQQGTSCETPGQGWPLAARKVGAGCVCVFVRAGRMQGRTTQDGTHLLCMHVCAGRGLNVFGGRLLMVPRSVQNAMSLGLSMAGWNPTPFGVALS